MKPSYCVETDFCCGSDQCQKEQNSPWSVPSHRDKEDLQEAQTQGEVTLLTNVLWIQVPHRIFYQPWEQGKKRERSLVIPIKFAFPCFAKELHSHSETKPLYDFHKQNWLQDWFFYTTFLLGIGICCQYTSLIFCILVAGGKKEHISLYLVILVLSSEAFSFIR